MLGFTAFYPTYRFYVKDAMLSPSFVILCKAKNLVVDSGQAAPRISYLGSHERPFTSFRVTKSGLGSRPFGIAIQEYSQGE